MNKKLITLFTTWSIVITTFVAPMIATASPFWWFKDQRQTSLQIAWAEKWWAWDEWFIWFVQSAVNWILALLWLISIIILVYWGFLMVTAAWDEWKYKKWFTILKQAVIWLILIWVSALIVNLVFSFVNTNSAQAGWWGGS